jgi:hypothetical protein
MYGMFFVPLCKQSNRWEEVLGNIAQRKGSIQTNTIQKLYVQYSLLDDEHVTFETYRRCEELN